MADTIIDIKKNMCGVSLGIGYEQTPFKLVNEEDIQILQKRKELFIKRMNVLTNEFKPLLNTLSDIINQTSKIDSMTQEENTKMYKDLKARLDDINTKYIEYESKDVWQGDVFEKDIINNTFFKKDVDAILEIITLPNKYTQLEKKLKDRLTFLIDKEKVTKEYLRLNTYDNGSNLNILNKNDIDVLKISNEIRSKKLEEYKNKTGKNGKGKTNQEIEDELNNNNTLLPPSDDNNDALLPSPDDNNDALMPSTDTNEVKDEDTDDEDIKTFKFTPNL